MSLQKELEEFCLQIYRETQQNEAFRSYADNHNGGFEILMGPPIIRPEIAFVGYQPGEWKLSVQEARDAGYEKSWVKNVCHYAIEDWRLARRLQAMFGGERLQNCVGLNAIFARAKSVAMYRRTPRDLRNRIRDYCVPQLHRLLDAMQPKKVVVIGFETMDLLSKSVKVDIGSARTLIKSGQVGNHLAIATPHLSAAWGLTGEDVNRVSRFVLS